MIHPPENTIVISPVGNLDKHLLEEIGMAVSRIFGYATGIVPLLDSLDFAQDRSRMQVHSTPVLERLSDLAPPNALKVLAVTRADLFIPILTHVYGEAQLGGKSCIISIHRLREGLSPISNPEDFYRRSAKEAIHELGHTFGLRHCREASCIMHYCRTIKDVDRKSDRLCRYCEILLNDEIKRLEKKE